MCFYNYYAISNEAPVNQQYTVIMQYGMKEIA